MREGRSRQVFKLRLLALVLAVALLWYSINPAPGPVSRHRPEGELPDEKRRELEPELQRAGFSKGAYRALASSAPHLLSSAPDDEGDDFEWPEFIDG